MTELDKKYKTLLHEINRERNTRREEQRMQKDIRNAAVLLWQEIEFKFTQMAKNKP